MNAYLITVTDLHITGTILAIVGRKWTSIYFAALPLMVIGRCCWAIFLLLQVREDGPLAESIGLETFISSLIVRLFAPACMIFNVNFKVFLGFVMLPTLIGTVVLGRMTEELYTSTFQCPVLFENYDVTSTLTRDIVLIICISFGIYSHSNTLVSRFINSEKAQLQQR